MDPDPKEISQELYSFNLTCNRPIINLNSDKTLQNTSKLSQKKSDSQFSKFRLVISVDPVADRVNNNKSRLVLHNHL